MQCKKYSNYLHTLNIMRLSKQNNEFRPFLNPISEVPIIILWVISTDSYINIITVRKQACPLSFGVPVETINAIFPTCSKFYGVMSYGHTCITYTARALHTLVENCAIYYLFFFFLTSLTYWPLVAKSKNYNPSPKFLIWFVLYC